MTMIRKNAWFLGLAAVACATVLNSFALAADQTPSLLGQWPLIENACDISGNGHDGVVKGGAVFSGDLKALALDGFDGYVNFGEDVGIKGSFTIAFWCSPDWPDANRPFMRLIGRFKIQNQKSLAIFADSQARLWTYLSEDGVADSKRVILKTTTQSVIKDSLRWYFVVVRWDASKGADGLSFFVDGLAVPSAAASDANISQLSGEKVDLTLGAFDVQTVTENGVARDIVKNPFCGMMSGLTIWDGVLSDDAIAVQFASGRIAAPAVPVPVVLPPASVPPVGTAATVSNAPDASPAISLEDVIARAKGDGNGVSGQLLAMGNSPSGPDFSGWMYNCPLFFSGYTRGENLTNFPVLVRIGTNLAGFAWSQFANSANGFELRFSDATGTQELNYEFDSGTSTAWINAAGIGQVWVQIPILTNGATILAYWGNAAQTSSRQAYTTNGAAWSNGFEAVWHLNESASPYRDSTLKHNATAGVIPSRTTDSMAGYAQSFNGSKYLTAGTINLGDKCCLSAWAKITTGASSCQTVLASKTSTTTSDGFGFHANTVSTSDKRLLMATGTGSSSSTAQTGINLLTYAAWHHVAALVNRSGATATLCVDGVNQTASSTIKSTFGNNKTTYLGQFSGGAYRFNGILDEVRIETAQRSTNWVWAEWCNMASNSAFQTWGGISSNNTPPIALFTATPTNGIGPLTVNFDALMSYDQDSDPLTYDWAFGDGNGGNGMTTQHTYTNAGSFTAVLTVNDGQGHASTNSAVISVPYLDSDGDGISNDWEVQYGLNPNDPTDSTMDPDNDGFPNIYEYLRGSDPISAASMPTPTIIVTNGGPETIQHAIDRATAYAIIGLTPGVYTNNGNVNLNFYGKKIMLTGMGDAAATVIDARNAVGIQGVVFNSYETPASVLRAITIRNCSPGDSFWNGGGIYIYAASPAIWGCVLESCAVIDKGGGVYCQGGNPMIVGCIFRNNRASYGGGIYLMNLSSVASPAISNCLFTGNSIYGAGGAIYLNNVMGLVINCTISSNQSITSSTVAWGAGVYVQGPAVLDGLTISNNIANNGSGTSYGGGVYAVVTAAGAPLLRKCTVVGNTTIADFYSRGGGIYVSSEQSTATIQIQDCVIQNNQSGFGGGLFIFTNVSINVSNVVLAANSASYSGGGCYEYLQSDATFQDCQINDNAANTGSGGALRIDGPNTITIDRCSFNNNASVGKGGAIYSDNADNTIIDSTFTGNGTNGSGLTCTAGGACYLDFGSAEIWNCAFVGNISSGDGGGALNIVSASSTEIVGCTISSNQTSGAGGGAQLNGPTILEDVIVTDNQAGTFGGGLYMNGNLDVHNCLIKGNLATSNGGGIRVLDGGFNITLNNLVVNGNSGSTGGGLYLGKSTVLNAVDCAFQANTAVGDGGALWGTATTGSFDRCTFTDNQTGPANNGSAIRWEKTGGLSMLNCYAGGNASSSTVYLTQIKTALVQNCTFADNANLGGATVYNYRSTNLVLRNTILWNNTVTQIVDNVNNPSQLTKVDSCCVQSGFTNALATNVVTGDPFLTAGYLLLYAASSCVDTGSPAGMPNIDLDGQTRVYCDIGCGAFIGDKNSTLPSTGWLEHFFGTTNVDPDADPNHDGLIVRRDYLSGNSPVDLLPFDALFVNGMAKTWLWEHFGAPTADPNADPDGDGFTNLQEYLQGTDPNVPDDSDPQGIVNLRVFTLIER